MSARLRNLFFKFYIYYASDENKFSFATNSEFGQVPVEFGLGTINKYIS
jgi:hypothetical protein